MNEVIKCIKERRSIRSYKSEVPSDEVINTLLDAAVWAPSASNTQPWHFTVITDKELLEELDSRAKPPLLENIQSEKYRKMISDPNYKILFDAPCLIMVSSATAQYFGHHDCGCAVQNICLAAHSLGLGTCIIGFLNHLLLRPEGADLLKRLNLPDGYRPCVGITVGYPGDKEPENVGRSYQKFNFIK